MRNVSKRLSWLKLDQHGITGLETAIVLIAFVVVASVFAFAVLSTGLLSSEKSKETVLGGLEETQSTIVLRGSVIGHASTTLNSVDRVTFQVSNATQGAEAVDLSPSAVVVSPNPPKDTDGRREESGRGGGGGGGVRELQGK